MNLGAYRIRLVDDAKDWWRWSSLRLMAVSGAIQAVLLAFPAALAQYVPSWVMSWLATTSLIILILAGVGRISQVEKANEPQPPVPPVQPR